MSNIVNEFKTRLQYFADVGTLSQFFTSPHEVSPVAERTDVTAMLFSFEKRLLQKEIFDLEKDIALKKNT